MKNTNVNIIVNQQFVRSEDIVNQSLTIQAIPNMTLVLKDAETGMPLSGIKGKRVDDDLILSKEDEEVALTIADYYSMPNVELSGISENSIIAYNAPETVVEHSLSANTASSTATSANDGKAWIIGGLATLGVVGLAAAASGGSSNDNKHDNNSGNKPADASVSQINLVKSSINEGETLSATVKLSDKNGNAKLAFSLSGKGITADDYGTASFSNGVSKNADGTLNVPKGVDTFNITLPIKADKATEGNETLAIKIGDKTQNVTIADTSVASTTPTKDAAVTTLSTVKSSINEGEALSATVKLSDKNGNAKLAFSLSGKGITADDYGTASFSNGVSKNADGTLNVPKGVDTFNITLPIKADKATEGNETLAIKVGDKTQNVTIADTSVASKTPTKDAAVTTLSTVKSSVNEGETLSATVKLSDKNGNAKLAFSLSGKGITADDYGTASFSNGVSKNADGTLNVPKGVDTFNITLPIKADKATEGNETLAIKVGDKTQNVTIADTSVAVVQGINLDTRIIDNKWDLQGGPTEKDRLGDSNHFYVKGNGNFLSYLYHHTDGKGTLTTNGDDIIRVGDYGRVQLDGGKGQISPRSSGTVVSVDLADGNDHLSAFGQYKATVYTGKGNDVYQVNYIGILDSSGDPSNQFPRVFMEEGNDELETLNISSSHIYLGSGNDKIKVKNNVEGSIINLGTDNFKYTYDGKEYDNYIKYKDIYPNAQRVLSKAVDSADASNEVVITGLLNGSTIYGGASNDHINIENAHQSVIKLGDGDNTISVNNSADISLITQYRSTITTGTGNDIVTLKGADKLFDMNLGSGNNKITIIEPENKSDLSYRQKGNINTGEGNDIVTIKAGYSEGNINLGDGENELHITARHEHTSNIITGKDKDSISIVGVIDGGKISTGGGDDKVEINGGESRKYLLGNAEIDLGDGNNELIFTGNISEKYSVIAQGGNDKFTVNGNTAAFVNLGDGKNVIKVTGYGLGTFITGKDDDVIELGASSINLDTSSDITKIDVGEGNNRIIINKGDKGTILADDTLIKAGDGDDILEIDGSITNISNRAPERAPETGIKLGSGKNTINITGYNNLNIETKNGNDEITIGDNQGGSINVGEGNNTVKIRGIFGESSLTVGNNSFTSGNGNDILEIDKASVARNINMGDGNNTLKIGSVNKSNITMGNGNDIVDINGGNGNGINLGNGENTLSINGGSGRDSITTGKDKDKIHIKGSVSAGGKIETGDGGDRLIIEGDLINGTAIKMGKDANELTIQGEIKKSNLTLGNGDDIIDLAANVTGDETHRALTNSILDAGDGNNTITLHRAIWDSTITTGNGNDNITIHDKAEVNSKIFLGDGNDVLSVKGISNDIDEINGGNGVDILNITGDNSFGNAINLQNYGVGGYYGIKGFEFIDMASEDGKGINTLTLTINNNIDRYKSYVDTLDGVDGLYIRGDVNGNERDKVEGVLNTFNKTSQTTRENVVYNIYENAQHGLKLYIQDGIEVM